MKTVSIMLATYNGGKYLEEQIESIINQNYSNWKLLISDDCSNDNTESIINKFVEQYPEKIRAIKNETKIHSASGNFINLFKNISKSDYYMFCDQDDIWLNTKIEKFVDLMEKEDNSKPILAYCDLKIVDKKLNIIEESFLKYTNNYPPEENVKKFILENHIPGCVMFFNHSLKEKIKEIPNECFMHDWWIALVASCFGKIMLLDETLNLYRQHENNVVGGIENRKKRNIKYLISKYKERKEYNTSILNQLLEFEKRYEIKDESIKKVICETVHILKSKNPIKKYRYFIKNNYTFKNKSVIYRYAFIGINKKHINT